ncbi:hypothetical protein BMF94_1569 [Rhodotorula taiwanensis]|uniref:Uncharacterized protein n=1 Tax=Rhodotorula taiwanensis TaxID=741276 RepID=A0A2S5BF06_9BASI|nr:hypothetical protein BMF94_1569 [Rhodotorula taiwanensis]
MAPSSARLDPATARSLYRSFRRALARVSRNDGAKRVNLTRLYSPQLRTALVDSDSDPPTLKALLDRTVSLLSSSPALTRNLASLSYHHTPYPLARTNTSSRLYSHAPKPIQWNPQDPEAARRAALKRHRDDERDPTARIARAVEKGLERVVKEAERRAGGGPVWLGRWTTADRIG